MATTRTAAKSRGNGSDIPSTEDVEKQFEQLRSDIASLTDTVQRMGVGKVNEAQHAAKDAGQDLTEAYEGALHSLQAEFDTLESNVTRQVRSNPLQALGLAAGVGFLLAVLTRK